MLFADFDWLPPPDKIERESKQRLSMLAEGEPIITCMQDLDHECYLRAPPFCDILFPTHFRKLGQFAQKTLNKILKKKTTTTHNFQVNVQKQADFLLEYGTEEVKSTQSWLTGYSPLFHDFGNCSVMTVTQQQQKQ